MKFPKRLVIALIALLLITSACGFFNTTREVVVDNTDIYDEAVTMINACEIENANYSLVINGNKAKIDSIVLERIEYYEAVIGNTATWTGNINETSEKLDEQLSAASGSPTLADLQEKGAFPGDIQSGLNLYFQALTQAPPPEISAEFAQSIVDIKAEAFDSMIYAGTKVNDKCGKYNTWYDTTEGQIIQAVSEKVGYPLPAHIKLVTGASGENTDSFK